MWESKDPVNTEHENKEINFLKEAFFNGYNLAMLCAGTAFGALNWDMLPLIAGIVLPLEALYLLVVPDQGWFQRWIRLQHGLERKEEEQNQRKRTLESFSPEMRARYQRLLRMKEDIERKCKESNSTTLIRSEDILKLDSYLDSFIYFVQFRSQCLATKLSIDTSDMQKKIQRLEKELELDKDKPDRQQVNILRQENIKMIREMLDRVQRLDGYIAMVDAQTEGIENTLHLLQVRMATTNFQAEGEVELVSADINHLLEGIHYTEKSIEEASKDMVKIKKLARLPVT